ncbi:MAG: exodeoxyribonuclease V subunit gamma [Burkholderiaceae bacterium]
MLRIEFDSDPGALARRLVDALAPAGRPVLVPDVVLVPTMGVGAWIERLVAERYGIAGLLEISLGGRYIWAALERLVGELPARSPFEPERARWVVLEAFEAMPEGPDGEPLRSRLAQLPDRERFELASAIARGFDRYLAFRRDWLHDWGRDRLVGGNDPAFVHERWQRWLWRRLLDELPNVSRRHPFDRFRDVLDRARHAGGDALERLGERLAPGRIFVFGALSMSPEQFRLLGEFGRLRDIHWFAPDPSRDFWEHVVSPAEAARLAGEDPSQAWLFDSEPAILGAWGKSQRDFLAQLRLLEDDAQVEIDDSFREQSVAPPRDALDALRKAVLLLDDDAWSQLPADDPDRSIELHATHGEIRQVEVLHDRLLDAFESLPGLTPGDVVVYCSDIERFAPAIDAVFGSAPAARRLPYRIADRGPRVDPVVRAALHLLALATGRREAAALLALLGDPLVRESCGLDEDGLRRLTGWLAEAGIHHDEKREPEARKHGWRAGLERLVLGMLANDSVAVVGGRRRIGGPLFADADTLERVLAILGRIDDLGGEPRQRAPTAWARALLEWCEAMLAPAGADAPGLARLRDAVARVVGSAAGIVATMPLEVFAAALETELAAGGGAARAGGTVTVCTLGALPGVPFRVTAMLGLDDEAWPRRSRRLEFDLMAAMPRFGDRLARFDDRGAFLDAVLATGDRLLAFHTGRDARDDSARNPSAQLRELRDYLQRMAPGRIVLHQHGLQVFGASAFDESSPQRSFASEWLGAARAIQAPPAARKGLPAVAEPDWRPLAIATGQGAAASAGDPARLADILADLASPAQSYCREVLGIRRPQSVAAIDQVAPFDPDAIDATVLQHVLAPVWRGEVAIDALPALVEDAPWAPAGVGEALMSHGLRSGVGGALEARAALLGSLGLPDAPGDSRVLAGGDEARLLGELDGIHGGRLQLLVSVFGANPRALIDAWLRHALWVGAGAGAGAGGSGADADAGAEPITVLVFRQRNEWRATRIGLAGSADAAIAHALAWSRRIRSEALPLFPHVMPDVIAAGLEHDPFDPQRALEELVERLGKDRPWSAHASGRFAYEILWRSGTPDARRILEVGLAAYGPIFGPNGRSSTIGKLCKSLGQA